MLMFICSCSHASVTLATFYCNAKGVAFYNNAKLVTQNVTSSNCSNMEETQT